MLYEGHNYITVYMVGGGTILIWNMLKKLFLSKRIHKAPVATIAVNFQS